MSYRKSNDPGAEMAVTFLLLITAPIWTLFILPIGLPCLCLYLIFRQKK